MRDASNNEKSRLAASSRMINMSVPNVVLKLPKKITEVIKAYWPKPTSPMRRAMRMANNMARPCEPSRPTSSQAVFFATRTPRLRLSTTARVASLLGFITEGNNEEIPPTPPGRNKSEVNLSKKQGGQFPQADGGHQYPSDQAAGAQHQRKLLNHRSQIGDTVQAT